MGTEQPDQITISSSEMDLEQARDMLYSLPDPNNQDTLAIVGKLGQDTAAGNRNPGGALSRMLLSATIDGDDVTHPQRTELIRWVYRTRPFSLLAHALQHGDVGPRIPCIPDPKMLEPLFYNRVYDIISANGTKPPGRPIVVPKVDGKRLKNDYAAHMTTAYETSFFRVVQWTYGVGEDQRFDRGVVIAAEKGKLNDSYYLRFPLLYYLQVFALRASLEAVS
jgi:hypothetical protein